ncbi:hypothetical protein N8I74_17825 [Chitiniphilus purpureus]|uniref:YqjK-like protein n=1 Tax=Chitiniphilus purpureus TaxID=2981137 RepID=A0ABY6DTG1_9NEIS|nr:hypothetical protein [Chitiniphilus sp. CD1]UXY15148.1 hypothetical protein N8I74_17825 [Chitiniphilus sp. CD1]
MNQHARSTREARKKLLQLEAELHRVELTVSLHDLRNPFRSRGESGWLSRIFKQPGPLLTLLVGTIAGNQLGGLSRLVPMALGAWKVLKAVRRFLARRRHPH